MGRKSRQKRERKAAELPASRIILPDGYDRHNLAPKGAGNPNAANTIIRRTAAEGGYADVTDTNRGQAWYEPRFLKMDERGVRMSQFDLYAESTEITIGSWLTYAGIHTNRQHTMNADKSQSAMFFYYKPNKSWAAAIYASKWFLLACEEFNQREWGARMDEYLNRSLWLTGQEINEHSRRTLAAVLDKAWNAYSRGLWGPRSSADLKMQMAREIAAKYPGSEGYIDRAKRYSRRTGERIEDFKEGVDGKLHHKVRTTVGG